MPFTYVLYEDIQAYHQRHRLQSSGWTAHQRVTGYVSTGYKPKSFGSGGSVLIQVLRHIRRLLFVLVIYTLCGASALQYVKLQRSLSDTAVRDSKSESTILFVQMVCDRTLQY